MHKEFLNQRVVVTGGTRGIGRAISLAFLAAGARVVATYRGNDAAAEELREAAGALGERLQTARCDVADKLAVLEFWESLGPEPVQVLVNNAGIRRDAILPLLDEEAWQEVIDTNLSGSYRMTRQAVKRMLAERQGRIIFVTSPAAEVGFQGQTNYGASKAGQQGLMRSLTKEVGARGITVNCVSPGFIETELLADLGEDQKKEYKKLVPARRFGRPEEVAAAVLFLASAGASFVSGTTLEVTGGL